MTDEGALVIAAKCLRTQEGNRLDAVQRLVVLIQKALEKPVIRRATRPSLTAKSARVDEKKKRGDVKRTRRYDPEKWE
jgi:ribosome-associated protein